MMVKWMGITVVELASNLVGVDPKNTVRRWDKAATSKNPIPCPQIVIVYNKSMGRVDLADMISLYTEYQQNAGTSKYCHLIDICKVNGWIGMFCNFVSSPSTCQVIDVCQ